MISFEVSKDNKQIVIELDSKDTFFELKKRIINEFNCSNAYIDINFLLERPIR